MVLSKLGKLGEIEGKLRVNRHVKVVTLFTLFYNHVSKEFLWSLADSILHNNLFKYISIFNLFKSHAELIYRSTLGWKMGVAVLSVKCDSVTWFSLSEPGPGPKKKQDWARSERNCKI